MKTHLRFLPTVNLGLLFSLSPFLQANPAPAPVEKVLLTHLIIAIENTDYAAFVAEGDVNFKHLDKARFDSVASELSPKLKNGYELKFNSGRDEDGSHVTYWTVIFKDGSANEIATLAAQNGVITGFLINPAHGH